MLDSKKILSSVIFLTVVHGKKTYKKLAKQISSSLLFWSIDF